jgi:hypothetical protein
MPTPPNYQGLYNNGGYYGLGATVLTDGNPYGINGYYFIRTGNPGNPGYPPSSDGTPNGSWTLYTFPKMVSGLGSITGSGNIMGTASTGGGFANVYTFPNTTEATFFIDGSAFTAVFYNDPAEILYIPSGTLVTVSGLTGPYTPLNGTTFTVDFIDVFPGYNYLFAVPGDTFSAGWNAVGLPAFGFIVEQTLLGMVWSWN